MQEFKVNDKVKTNDTYTSWEWLFKIRPFENGIITALKEIDGHKIARIRIGRTIREMNVKLLEHEF